SIDASSIKVFTKFLIIYRLYSLNPSISLFLTSIFIVSVANANEEPYPPETVLTRIRPELDPQGLRVHSFKFLPKLTVQEQFNDNIFSTNNDETSDFITWMTPRVNVESDWSRHALGLIAETTVRKYAQHSGEDTVDYIVQGHGRLDLPDNDNLSLSVDHSRNHELRQSPNEISQAQRPNAPTTYESSTVLGSYLLHFNPLSLKTGFNYTNRDFNGVKNKNGAPIAYTSFDRDRDEITGDFQLTYDRLQRFSPFLRGSVNNLDYKSKKDRNNFNRDSTGYKVDVGAQIFFSGVLFGEMYIGHMGQYYQDSKLDTVSGMSGGGEITWLPSGLTTVKLSTARSINPSVLGNVSGVMSTDFKVNVDHELLRNLLLNSSFGVNDAEYVGSTREDTYYTFSIGANYLMNRIVNIGLHYDLTARNSNEAVNDFTSNTVFLDTKIQF
ncbi:MAG: outer membrane beta-barrel protein, partial [Methylococcales bacterium]